MFGTIMERVIVERHRHALEEAHRRRTLDTEWDGDLERRPHTPAFSLWRALVALIRRS
ncbi:MAG: hypothetical protein R6W77_14110 [Trueperaceae bacterium]